jgi:hypothetical protein
MTGLCVGSIEPSTSKGRELNLSVHWLVNTVWK